MLGVFLFVILKLTIQCILLFHLNVVNILHRRIDAYIWHTICHCEKKWYGIIIILLDGKIIYQSIYLCDYQNPHHHRHFLQYLYVSYWVLIPNVTYLYINIFEYGIMVGIGLIQCDSKHIRYVPGGFSSKVCSRY